ncbi:MAG: hypothetical protein IE885_08285, partial [Campylobacterales bacterium]|nr:hypothetical protein [Campylobacterales bacterium]
MSGIFGIFNRNGKPVDQEIVDTILEINSYWEPDAKGSWIEGSVALGNTMLWSTPESKYENLPLHKNTHVLTMDARIDNREELAKELVLPHLPLDQIGDSEFILAAYKKWGEECPKYLLGDFAFAIWDQQKQQMFCARDHIGIKPFYYHLDGDLFLFCNDMKGLIAYPGLSKVCNDEAVAIYLSVGELWHPTMTFFENTKKLPPATTLTVTKNGAVTKTYWRVEESPKIHLDSFDSYVERLRELLENAVQVRLRSAYPVASHLSGGLDSSSVAVLAARFLFKKNESLKVYNWVPAPDVGDDPHYYEWANSRVIAEIENIEHHYVQFDEDKLLEILLHHDIALNDTVDLWYEFSVRKEAHKAAVRTMLSGWGGDELISYHGRAYFTDIFQKGKSVTAIKQLWEETSTGKQRWRHFVSRCYRELLLPFFPSKLHCLFPKVICGTPDYSACVQDDFINCIVKKRHKESSVGKKSIREDQLYLYRQGHIINRVESWASSAFKDRIEYSYPLLDKRIVEFALGLPPEMYYQNKRGRFLFREVLGDLLPEHIRYGNFKAEPKRVSMMIKIIIKAIKKWENKVAGKSEIVRMNKNNYINFDKL